MGVCVLPVRKYRHILRQQQQTDNKEHSTSTRHARHGFARHGAGEFKSLFTSYDDK